MVLIHVLISTFLQGLVVLHWIIKILETSIFKKLSNIFTSLYEENFFTIEQKFTITVSKVGYGRLKYQEHHILEL